MPRLLSSFLLLLIAFAIAPRDSFAQAPDDPDEVIRVDTDVTNLPFTAIDKQKRFITTLQEADIRVFEDGVPQQLFTFQRETDRPLALALLIDISASEERTLPAEKAAARSFIETVLQSRKDQAAVIPFTGSAFLEQSLTRDVLGIYRALERVEVAMPAYLGSGRAISGIVTGPGTRRAPPEGSTAIWDAIALTASEVLAQDSTPGHSQRRRAIILLTDGQDTSSVLAIDQAIDGALAAETVIYAIGIGDSKYEGVDRGVLRTVAERTGGRAFFPKKDVDLKQVFGEIERELRTQYLLAYSSTNKKRDGAFRQMRVEVVNPELIKEKVMLRHRPGYFAKRSRNNR
ncbi:MAG TPA: VWA domain-containing protein [Pyrinomonadaceae bacterium]|nr:VWA domain-containing protein [Pyrinomonadaceae bacterium]